MRHAPDQDDEVTQVIIEEHRSTFGPFLVGALLGAAAALLLAPRSGAETQAELRRAARRLGDGAQERVDALRARVDTRAGQVRTAVDSGRTAARSARSELRRRVDEAKATFRGGGGGVALPAPAPPAATVVVTGTSTETGAGDLAR